MIRRYFVLFLFICVCSSVASAQTPNATITMPRITSPRLDGDLTDLCWTEASQQQGKVVMDLSNTANSRSKSPRVAYMGYDSTALYFAVIDYSPDATKLASAGKTFWQGDSLEIYVNWDRKDTKAYVQIGMTCNGDVFVRPADGKERSPKDIQVVVKKEGIRWQTEVAVPFSFLGVPPPKPGDEWGINFCGRQVAFKTDSTGLLTWNATYGGFENPIRFAIAKFGD